MKKKVIFLIVALSFAFGSSFAQGYRIEATLKGGLKDSSYVLGYYHYTNTSFFAKDTARLDSKGNLVFEGKEQLPGGLYLILFPDKAKFVEVIISGKENTFSMATDTADLVGNMVVKGSEENRLFYDFNKQIRAISRNIEQLDKQLKQVQEKEAREAIQKKIGVDQARYRALRDKFIKDNAGTFAAQLIDVSRNPDIPAAPKLKDGSEDRNWVYNYYKSHFWDGFDFTDDRLLRTPFIKPKLEQYFDNLVVQVPDSICKEADQLIERAKGSKDMKTYLIYFITQQYENSKVIGTEPVFVHMAEKYYLSGQMELSEEGLNRVRERVAIAKPLLPGKIIPNISLSDTLKKPFKLHDIKANFTILYLYSPSCSHCKESVPKLKAFYDKNRAAGVKVLLVPTEESPEEWKKFIKNFRLGEMIHGYDYTHSIHYRQQFDVYSTPTVYFLDKDKRIITRKVPTDELEAFFQFQQKKLQEKRLEKPAGK